jgi:hypothetical protein
MRNRRAGPAVEEAMSRSTRRRVPVLVPAAGLGAVLLLAACSSGAAPSPTTVPSAEPPGTPVGSPVRSPEAPPSAPTGEISHPTGATEVVLRLGESGGMMIPTYTLAQVPYFTLYGDGTVIYRPISEPLPEVAPGDPLRFPQLHVATMTEDQVQALLRDALGPGGLGVARETYDTMFVSDAPTARFEVNADGREKTVSVYALGFPPAEGGNPGPDDEVLAALGAFGERLRNFDQEVAAGTATDAGLFEPTGYLASLLEGGFAEGPAQPWPWPAFGPDDFAIDDDGTGFGFPTRAITLEEVAALGVVDPAGGVSGIPLAGPDGTVYVLGIRPLLPDEAT